MAAHEKFNFKTLDDLRRKIEQLGADITLSEDWAPLAAPRAVGGLTAPNSLAVLPMEGCDCQPDGAPSELCARRYLRFAGGGAGLLWWEACAVTPEGRANELQMMLTPDNLPGFAALVQKANGAAQNAHARAHQPVHILQLTHSGRYSRPVGHTPAPLIPQRDPILDPGSGVTENQQPVSDGYLDELVGKYVQSAQLARQAGYHGVDIKACHRYLVSELLASHTRPGKYGGSFENRSRFLLDVVKEIKHACGPDFIIACRFNVFDAHPYPYGFGVGREDFWQFDETEPMLLVQRLCQNGVGLLSNSAGNPYYIYPQVTRPFDLSSMGIPVPQEHPLESIARLFAFSRRIQKQAGAVPVVGNGYSWLRQFLPCAGAANLAAGDVSFVGLGRSSFAYPNAPADILSGRGMDPKQCYTACSKCTQIMRDHGRTGCVVRDAKVYAPLYRQARADADARAAANQ